MVPLSGTERRDALFDVARRCHEWITMCDRHRVLPLAVALLIAGLVDAERLSRVEVAPLNARVLRFAEHPVARGVLRRIKAVAAGDRVPVRVVQRSPLPALSAPRAVVLRTGPDLIRHLHVVADLVELPDGQIHRIEEVA